MSPDPEINPKEINSPLGGSEATIREKISRPLRPIGKGECTREGPLAVRGHPSVRR